MIKGVTYQERLAAKKSYMVLLYRNYNTEGKQIYAYLQVRLDKVRDMKQAFNSGKPYNVADFGIVIASGYGDPSVEVQRAIQQKFGFNPEYYCDISTLMDSNNDEYLAEYLASEESEGGGAEA